MALTSAPDTPISTPVLAPQTYQAHLAQYAPDVAPPSDGSVVVFCTFASMGAPHYELAENVLRPDRPATTASDVGMPGLSTVLSGSRFYMLAWKCDSSSKGGWGGVGVHIGWCVLGPCSAQHGCQETCARAGADTDHACFDKWDACCLLL